MKNPIAITPQALPGRRLPPGWKPEITTHIYDQRALEDLWKAPQWSAKPPSENLQQSSRLAAHPSWSDLLGER